MTGTYRKKLIEVALPLAEINAASAREKSIRHGHPSTLHLWWARRPLAACRAVLFGQLVDDPSSVPEEFPTEADQARERERLFEIIKQLVLWENSNNQTVLDAAKREIARSVARDTGLAAPIAPKAVQQFLIEHAPPVLDPFCGGGSIPLEAQRLGLRAYGSDLNPVAVLITKALIEIPPKFAGQSPVNPEDRARMGSSVAWPGASGLAADVRYYGRWMRDEAQRRIGHLYPKVQLPGGGEATVIAWLWARTVKCPNPACRGQMPLVRSLVLSTKRGKQVWVEPVMDHSIKSVRFEVQIGQGVPAGSPKVGRGARFRCLVCGQVAPDEHIKAEGTAGHLGVQLLAVVSEGQRGRVYLSPTLEGERITACPQPAAVPSEPLANDPRAIWCVAYGLTTFGDLFSSRQLVMMTTYSHMVTTARERVLADCGDEAYSDAVATYLGLGVSKLADYNSTVTSWSQGRDQARPTFSRQGLPMTWDFAEVNTFGGAAGDLRVSIDGINEALRRAVPDSPQGHASQRDAQASGIPVVRPLISTDPPYYDNIGYADLSDFFYVWLRRSLGDIHPDLFETLLTPKAPELVATPYRFGGSKEKAQRFFEDGLGKAFANMRAAQHPTYPVTVFYAFKQAETEENDDEDEDRSTVVSTGWETMLEGLLGASFQITGTWPMRTERGVRSISLGTNALASSIVLVCRPRPVDASFSTRRDFVAALKRELPGALRTLQQGNIAPVDLQQAAIGPGMAVFSRYRQVVDPSGRPLPVRAALGLINQALDEVLSEQEGDFDGGTRWAITWFEQYGLGEGEYGSAETLSKAKDTSVATLQAAGIVRSRAGKVRLLRRDELPAAGPQRSAWVVTQQLIRALQEGGEDQAARLLGSFGSAADAARELAYRLFLTCERKGGLQEEAGAYNGLVVAWPTLVTLAGQQAAAPRQEAMV